MRQARRPMRLRKRGGRAERSSVAGLSSWDRQSQRLGAKRSYAFTCPPGRGGAAYWRWRRRKGEVGAICEEVKRREDKG